MLFKITFRRFKDSGREALVVEARDIDEAFKQAPGHYSVYSVTHQCGAPRKHGRGPCQRWLAEGIERCERHSN